MSAAATAEAPLAPATARVPLVDAARGAALVGMAIYHFVWDLGFFGLIPRDWPYDPRFVLFGHAVAASFLALVGVSLALAARDGLDM
ncbi:MAG TPA: heparan-alpha-glucosaminide N-acetyltransferase domain-containing protein, partial [Beijerinckiaceae bacterium]